MKILECMKLWQLLEKALADLKACEERQDVRIDMAEWCAPGPVCAVCMAGAMLVIDDRVSPYYDLDAETRYKLLAIEHLRTGSTLRALLAFYSGRVPECHVKGFYVPSYKASKELFHRAMNEILDHLKEIDL